IAVLAARFGIFLVPIAASENNTSLARAAALSRGNTWRLLIVAAALLIPVFVFFAAAESLVLGPPVRTNLLRALSVGMPDRALETLAWHAPAIGAVASTAIVSLLALIAGASAVSYSDRCEDVPLEDRAPAKRRGTGDARDVSAPLVGTGQVPAFAKVHPLATFLPSEMPLTDVHQADRSPLSPEVQSAEAHDAEVVPMAGVDGSDSSANTAVVT